MLFRIPHASTNRKAKLTLRYPGDLKDIPYSPRTSKCGLAICKAKYRQLQKRLLLAKNRRQAKNIATLKGLLSELKNKFTLSDHALASMEVRFINHLNARGPVYLKNCRNTKFLIYHI